MTFVSLNTPHPRSSPATYATTGVLGGFVGAGVATGIGLVTRTPIVRLLPRIAVAGAAAAGVAMLGDRLLGGTLGAMTWGQRNQAWFAVRHLTQPGAISLATSTYADAKAQQQRRYGMREQLDNGNDAERHAWATAALAARLVSREGFDVDDARAFTLELGAAHERDGVDNFSHSSEMDRHNNAVGAELGLELQARLGREPSADELLDAVRGAIASGRMLVVDAGQLRRSRTSDLGTPRR